MSIFKPFISFIIKFFAIILIILVVIAGLLLIYYFITIETSENYIPDDFLFYIKIKSIKHVYENIIDLKAADVLFSSSKDLLAIQKAITDFKSSKISKNFFLEQLLNFKAYIIVGEDFTPVIVFDPGLLSLATRFFPIINTFFKLEGLTLNIIQKGRRTIFNYKLGNNQDIYFSFKDNLIFLSTKVDQIDKLYTSFKSKKNLKSMKEIVELKKKISTKDFIEIYTNTNTLLSVVAEGNKELKSIFNELVFSRYSALSFKISNKDLQLNTYANIKTNNTKLDDFLSYNPAGLKAIRYLPAQTNIYTSVNFSSFKELIELLFYFKEGPEGKTIKKINNSVNFLLGDNLDTLLFSWIGREAGAFSLIDSQDPIIFLRIKDQLRLNDALDKIKDTFIFDGDSILVLDNVRINRIKFPDFIKGIISLFIKGIEAPYYIIIGDYIFLSTNAENLASLSNDYKSNKNLIGEKSYKKVSRGAPKNANLFLYYDLSTSNPFFLNENNILFKFIKLYEKGIISIYFNKNEIRINVSSTGISGNKTMPYPGYPKKIKDGLSSNIYCANVKGTKTDELIYISKKNNLVIQDIIDGSSVTAPVDKNSDIYLPVKEDEVIYVFSKSGNLYKFDNDAKSIDPFPIISNFKGSFFPVTYKNQLVFFSGSSKTLSFISLNGEEVIFPFTFKSPLLTPPAFYGDKVSFYPKSFSGTVYVTDIKGNLLDKWPKEGGGISYCSPVIINQPDNKPHVIFLTQSGNLNLWDIKGNLKEGFPVNLDGIYYNNPQLISSGIISKYKGSRKKGILTLSAKGKLTLLSLKGEILKNKTIQNSADKNNEIILFDFDRDGIEEIFIYGVKNYIIGLGQNFEPLPGFPVKGSMKPCFTDLNFDRIYEMLIGSYDNNIYAYTLKK